MNRGKAIMDFVRRNPLQNTFSNIRRALGLRKNESNKLSKALKSLQKYGFLKKYAVYSGGRIHISYEEPSLELDYYLLRSIDKAYDLFREPLKKLYPNLDEHKRYEPFWLVYVCLQTVMKREPLILSLNK